MDVLILALATWRIAHLLAEEDGPWRVFEHARHIAGVRYDEYGGPVGQNELARALLCVWCSSIWIGAVWAALHSLGWREAIYLALPFALSTIAILINELLEWLDGES